MTVFHNHSLNSQYLIQFYSQISDSCKEHKVVVGKDNGWIGSGSKPIIPRIPMSPATPPVSPSIRRRSLGVLKTPDKIEKNSSPSLRRRSLVLPVRYVQGNQSPCFSRKKSLVSPDVTELTGSEDSRNCRHLRYM